METPLRKINESELFSRVKNLQKKMNLSDSEAEYRQFILENWPKVISDEERCEITKEIDMLSCIEQSNIADALVLSIIFDWKKGKYEWEKLPSFFDKKFLELRVS